MSEPMSDERLAELYGAFLACEMAYRDATADDPRERAAIAGFWNARNIIPAQRAEINRLRAERAEWARLAGLMEGQRDEALEIVRAVAHGPHWAFDLYNRQQHARALLARSTGATGDGGEGDAR